MCYSQSLQDSQKFDNSRDKKMQSQSTSYSSQQQIVLKRSKRLFENKYESFADPREGNDIQILINGKYYFESLFKSLMSAKRSIYICGWAVSPELFLIRPVSYSINNQTRLMDILTIKAKENVVIKILVYREVPYTLSVDSLHTKKLLNSLHPNISVRRFPQNGFPYTMWANHEKMVVIDNSVAFIGGIDLFWGRWDFEEFRLKEESNPQNLYNWPGIDFSNDRLLDRLDLKNYMKEYVDRDKTCRMPWHDIACRIEGPAVIDVFRHFFQRWSYAVEEKTLFPISFDDHLQSLQSIEINSTTGQYQSYSVNPQSLQKGNFTCQILRSVSKWSSGNPTVEHSILNAYCELIDNSEHYIFLQNQFFISNSATSEEYKEHKKVGNSKIINNIALHIRKRIERAAAQNQKFRVFILLPLITAFSGKVRDTQSIKTIFKYTYRTISRHRGLSLVEKLIENIGAKFLEYITFLSLRNHTDFKGVPKTEIIYIHSKIMIVDDMKVLIGSANINDRSLLGERDSELAVLINPNELSEEDYLESIINGEKKIVSKMAYEFRVNLMKIHLGISKDDPEFDLLNDPLNDDLFKLILKRAHMNTVLYREIFKVIPDDIYETFEEFKYAYKDTCSHCIEIMREKYASLKNEIKGFLVEFPIGFLKKENLNRGFTKENLVNVDLFL